uniref:hypothetical protein n=1 Tax=Candidatus Limisoma sp. TaxID=3076476 RepID=UPI004029C585
GIIEATKQADSNNTVLFIADCCDIFSTAKLFSLFSCYNRKKMVKRMGRITTIRYAQPENDA